MAPELRLRPCWLCRRLVLVESIPQDLPFAAGSPSARPLAQAWLQLLDAAQESIHIASYYWSLTGPDIGVNDTSALLVRTPPPPLPQQAGPPIILPLSWGAVGEGPLEWGAAAHGQSGLAGRGPSAEAAARPGQEHLPGGGHQPPDAGQELH